MRSVEASKSAVASSTESDWRTSASGAVTASAAAGARNAGGSDQGPRISAGMARMDSMSETTGTNPAATMRRNPSGERWRRTAGAPSARPAPTSIPTTSEGGSLRRSFAFGLPEAFGEFSPCGGSVGGMTGRL